MGIDLINQPFADSIYVPTGDMCYRRWNPLDDDGDAFRLLTALRIELKQYRSESFVRCYSRDDKYTAIHWGGQENAYQDEQSAIRMAITCCAAGLGKTLHTC